MTSPNGLLFVDKPSGPTSHDIVDQARRLLGTRRIGHAGTLDPFASGLLILGVNNGTKALTNLVGLEKTYEIEATLGYRTDTFDREGQPIGEPFAGHAPSREDVDIVLAGFRGTVEQKAPLFSAIKRQGKKLYELARAGVATEDMRPTRTVTIFSLELLDYTWPTLKLRAHVSSGTYVRSLVDDIGAALGTGAFVQELRRTHVGSYDVLEAISLQKSSKDDALRTVLAI